jgi:hypothetical protein
MKRMDRSSRAKLVCNFKYETAKKGVQVRQNTSLGIPLIRRLFNGFYLLYAIFISESDRE